jgi:hypothetical protein
MQHLVVDFPGVPLAGPQAFLDEFLVVFRGWCGAPVVPGLIAKQTRRDNVIARVSTTILARLQMFACTFEAACLS